MIYMAERWKATKLIMVLMLSLLLTGLVSVGSLLAQIRRPEDVDFEYMDTVTMKKGDVLWNLAKKYYGDPLKWTLIKDMNRIPNERRIPIGTVVYIPVKDAKRIVKKAEEEIIEKKVVVDETAIKMAEMQRELDRLKEELDACEAKCKELTDALNQKDGVIASFEARLKAYDRELMDPAELEARFTDMKKALKSAEEKEADLRERLKEKEEIIAKLESKLEKTRGEIEELKVLSAELKAKIEAIEKAPPPPVAKPVCPMGPGSRAIAMAIALVGSIVWLASAN